MARITKRDARGSKRAFLFLAAVLAAGIFVLASSAVTASAEEKQQELVDAALATLENFLADPDMSWFRDHVDGTRGLLIVPALYKAGYFLGGSGGRGLLLARRGDTGEWVGPAFYTVGSVSFGLQIGAKKSEVIMMVMSRKGLESLHSSSIKLGGEISVAAGPVGAGAEAATSPALSADFISFARSKGVFAGISLQGAVIKTNDDWNSAYYGKPARPVDILVTREVSNPDAAKLLEAVAKAAEKP